MAVATRPTIDTLTVEALKQAGYPNATAGDTYQLRSEVWLQEGLTEIWHKSNGQLKSLMARKITGFTTTDGTSNMEGSAIQDNPADFAHHIGVTFLEGNNYGVCQASTDGDTIILAADESLSASNAIGKEIIVFLTAVTQTSLAESAFIRNFNETTKTAELHSTLAFTPGTTHSYLIVDRVHKLQEGSVWTYDDIHAGVRRGMPHSYHPMGDSDSTSSINTIVEGGQFGLDPIPYWNSDGKLRAMRHRYYANILKVDVDDSATTKVFANILTNWRAELTHYIKYKALDSDKDPRAIQAEEKWERMKAQLVSREEYGNDLSNLSAIVDDGSHSYGLPLIIE